MRSVFETRRVCFQTTPRTLTDGGSEGTGQLTVGAPFPFGSGWLLWTLCLTAQLLFQSGLLLRLSEEGVYVPMSQLSPNNFFFSDLTKI